MTHRESFDIVSARAVARLNILDELCLPLVKEQGWFVALKGKKADEELKEAQRGVSLLGGKVEKTVSFYLQDHDDERHNIYIHKVKKTPSLYPRRYALIKKNPL